ncbi:Protein O-mannosyltransferase 2 [Coemansia sp. RSA 788]|nr:Protein O-mannosyltransferase 2 [Coemansia sp. RSA 788]KAJ2151425.1 Protein O-mannosyltransferase 2 [Coemansia sp. RSA 637]KAJ2292014.1 Protein O-mannosyltransferase 2 [Coemansia sp. RSA 355]KAJ2594001.1 Protein O-mannosyltransferase 2 [Coemansia sp. RSA 1797]
MGRFGAQYINGTFYHDLHPVAGKLLIGLSEYVSGHNGSFTYTSGAEYPPHINYVFQRASMAVIGSLIVPFAYRTCRFLGFGRAAATMGASFVLLDNALCVLSRFILLDPILFCFIAMALMGYAGFARHRHQAFSAVWWRWLAFTGLSLGLAISTKWIGAFVVALVGLCTIEELAILYSDRKTSVLTQIKHWIARVVCLICIPLLVYLISFQIHFALLRSRGTGDYKMPSQFQSLQRNNVVSRQPHDVAIGSQITIRSHLPGFGLIYANETHRFPDNADELVAAGMPGKQANNWWEIVSGAAKKGNDTPSVRFIADGDILLLRHVGTKRYLRTGNAKPHNQGWDRRVVAAGNTTAPSAWDFWRVHIVDDVSPRPSGRLYAVTTRIQLTNKISGCLLTATPAQLPKWGRDMSELICSQKNTSMAEGTLWNVEQVRDKRFKNANYQKLVKRQWLRDTVWINREMARSNNRLVPDPDRYKVIESSAWSWPFLIYPMRMGAWKDDSIKYYEIGNPILWWASAICCIFVYPAQIAYMLVCHRRKCSSWKPAEIRQFWDVTKLLWGGWFTHYVPFFFFGRVLYIHHVLPSLYFGLLLLAFEIQCAMRWYMPARAEWPVAIVIIAISGYVFYLFSPLTFGWDRPIKELAHLQWLPTWNLVTDPHLVL